MRTVIGAKAHTCRNMLISSDLASDTRQLRDEMRSLKDTVHQQGATIKAHSDRIASLTDTVSKQVATVKLQSAQIASLTDTVSKQGATIKTQNSQMARLTDTVSKQVKHSKTQCIQFDERMKTVSRQGEKLVQLENRIISLIAQGIVSSENKLAPDYVNSSNVHASLRNAHGDGIIFLFECKHINYLSASLSKLSKGFKIVKIVLRQQ